jgi:hypothetical protein
VAEGLSPSDVAKELAEHRPDHDGAHGGHSEEGPAKADTRRNRRLTILEAVLLAVVAVLAAWSGFAAAKWGTESSLQLAKASAARTQATKAQLQGLATKNFDSSTFAAWFSAYADNNPVAMAVAERRFRPNFDVAFRAWLKTNPFTNPNAPKGPTYMPEYIQPDLKRANALEATADAHYSHGESAGANSDGYVRTTVYLASVLFLVGISGHFAVRGARIALVGVGGAILVFAVVLLIAAPKPPG